MTSDEARERMTDALDGLLSPEERAAFDAALAADAALRAEYEELRALVEATARALGGGRRSGGDDAAASTGQAAIAPGASSPPDETAEAPDLLAGVQRKLHKRSGGRYYRDRFAQRAGTGLALPVVLAGVMLVVLALLYVATQWATIIDR
jgi:anti-sigma factor RsiW